MAFLDNPSQDATPVVTRIPGLAAMRNTAFGIFLNAFSEFLLDPVRVRAALALIDQRMWQKAQEQNTGGALTFDELATALAARGAGRLDRLRAAATHLLSNVLTAIENEHGFDIPETRRRAVTLSGLVENDTFRAELIELARTWKDPQVPATHGEFTHRLQWCAAMLAMPAIADWQIHYMNMARWVDNVEWRVDEYFGLWDALVDRNLFGDPATTPYQSLSAEDFRSPENLQAWLLEPAKRDPGSNIRLLSTFLSTRNAKRLVEQAAAGPGHAFPGPSNAAGDRAVLPGTFTAARWDKWSRVLFQNRITIALSWEEKALLARAWHRLAMLTDGDSRYPLNPVMVLAPGDQANVPAPDADLQAAYLSLGLNAMGLHP